MNLRRVLDLLGGLLLILGAAELLPIPWCLRYGETDAAVAFGATAIGTVLGAGVLKLLGTSKGGLYRREGALIVVGGWVLASLSGAVPYLLTDTVSHPVDALFESASGFTTTGASILVDIEGTGRGIRFWRSFTQWLGGMGIVVLFVALLSELGPGARFLFQLEVPGPKTEVLHPHVRATALTMWQIYLALSAGQCVLLLLAGLGPYDALTHTFSTVSTGGFSPHTASIAEFSSLVQIIVIVFMVLAGVNFSLYFHLLRRREAIWRDVELRFYIFLLLGAAVLITLDVWRAGTSPVGRTSLDALFTAASVLTTTGFATSDFNSWPDLSRLLLVTLMFVGGCAGSTAGGAKLIRLLVGMKAAFREVRLTFSPNSVIALVIGGKVVPNASARSVSSFLVLWIGLWATGVLLLSVGDTGLVTAASASIATLANIGPGLGAVGPVESYNFFSSWQKAVMVLLMWLGRLEVFVILALLQRRFWHR